MRCPRCQSELAPPVGGEHVCPGCAGRLLEPDAAEIELDRHVGLGRAELLELAQAFAGERLVCPLCQQQTRPLTLRSIPLDLCFGCGGLWLDAGELALLTGDSARELAAAPAPATAPAPAPAPTPAPAPAAVALVLRGDEAPPMDALVPALLQVGLTAIDARQWQSRASGVLVDRARAEAVPAFLGALGPHAALVAAVPAEGLRLPRAFDAPFVELRPEGLGLHDHHGRGEVLPFHELDALVVAGVKGAERKSELVEERHARSRGPDRVVLRHKVTDGEADDIVLALAARGTRVRVTAARLQGDFGAGQRARREGLLELSRDLAARVRPAALHPATRRALFEGAPLVQVRRLVDLDRELAWLAWRSRA